jgi:hypothetical protein
MDYFMRKGPGDVVDLDTSKPADLDISKEVDRHAQAKGYPTRSGKAGPEDDERRHKAAARHGSNGANTALHPRPPTQEHAHQYVRTAGRCLF